MKKNAHAKNGIGKDALKVSNENFNFHGAGRLSVAKFRPTPMSHAWGEPRASRGLAQGVHRGVEFVKRGELTV